MFVNLINVFELNYDSLKNLISIITRKFTSCGKIHRSPVELTDVTYASWSQIHRLWKNSQVTCGIFYCFLHF